MINLTKMIDEAFSKMTEDEITEKLLNAGLIEEAPGYEIER